MQYDDLTDAMFDLSASQIMVDVPGKKILLSALCDEGILSAVKFVIDELELEGDELENAIPVIARLDKVELLRSALGGDGDSILELIMDASLADKVSKKDFVVGSKFTATREIYKIEYGNIYYKDQTGKYGNCQVDSFKRWASGKL